MYTVPVCGCCHGCVLSRVKIMIKLYFGEILSFCDDCQKSLTLVVDKYLEHLHMKLCLQLRNVMPVGQ